MSKNLNKKSESVIKANSTKKTGTKKQYRNRNTYPLTNENSNVFNFANDTTSESYNTSNSSDLNDDESDDDDKTVITDYASNPYGLTTPPRVNSPVNEMDVDDNDEPPATELLTRHGKKMFYKINGKLVPVDNSNYNREWIVYDIHGSIIHKNEDLPEDRIINDIMEEEEDVKIGGKRQRKTRRKTMRKTIRKTKRKKTRRHRRRNTRKYK
jgi:hypothetical protein